MRTAILEEKSRCLDLPANEIVHSHTSLADGRYLAYVRAGAICDPIPVSTVACVIDPTDAIQIATMLKVSVAPRVFAAVQGLLQPHHPTLAVV